MLKLLKIWIKKQPRFSFFICDWHSLCITDDLVFVDLADCKVFWLRMSEVQAWHRARRFHCERLSQTDSDFFVDPHEFPHQLLLCVIGLRRVTRSRTDALVLRVDELFLAQTLIGSVAPEVYSDVFVQLLGHRFSETVGQRLEQYDAEVVVVCLKRSNEFVLTEASTAHKHADVVSDAGVFRRYKVWQSEVCAVFGFLLLSQCVQFADGCVVIVVQLDVIVIKWVARIKRNDSSTCNQFVFDDAAEHGLSFVEQFFHLLTARAVVEDYRIASVRVLASELPCVEERIPADVVDELWQVVVFEVGDAHAARLANHVLCPGNVQLLFASLVEWTGDFIW